MSPQMIKINEIKHNIDNKHLTGKLQWDDDKTCLISLIVSEFHKSV